MAGGKLRQVLKMYGVFILETAALLWIIQLCIQQSYLKEIGDFMPLDSYMYEAYDDFREVYQEESKKKPPEIIYKKGSLYEGKHKLSDIVEAYDYANRNLEIRVHSILTPEMEEKIDDYKQETEEILLDMTGIYMLTVSAVDDGNRKSVCIIRIPVNSQKGMG